MHLSTNRKNDFKEADATLDLEQRHFHQASLDYVDVLQTAQERMKFDFVELITSFLYNWMTFYTIGKLVLSFFPAVSYLGVLGHVIHEDFKPYFSTIKGKVQKVLVVSIFELWLHFVFFRARKVSTRPCRRPRN